MDSSIRPVTLDDIVGLERYEAIRDAVRRRTIDLKRARRLSVGPEMVIAARPNDEEEDPVPSWDGERYLVVWQTTRSGPTDIYGVWTAPDGTVREQNGLKISNGPSDELFPDVEWGGDSHLVVWQDLRSRRNWDIYGNRVTRAGVVRDSEDIADRKSVV